MSSDLATQANPPFLPVHRNVQPSSSTCGGKCFSDTEAVRTARARATISSAEGQQFASAAAWCDIALGHVEVVGEHGASEGAPRGVGHAPVREVGAVLGVVAAAEDVQCEQAGEVGRGGVVGGGGAEGIGGGDVSEGAAAGEAEGGGDAREGAAVGGPQGQDTVAADEPRERREREEHSQPMIGGPSHSASSGVGLIRDIQLGIYVDGLHALDLFLGAHRVQPHSSSTATETTPRNLAGREESIEGSIQDGGRNWRGRTVGAREKNPAAGSVAVIREYSWSQSQMGTDLLASAGTALSSFDGFRVLISKIHMELFHGTFTKEKMNAGIRTGF
ncbi:hypothetical protein C8J57DRAFT_1229888 [Mycena rebaudengoi]|nr:hypothetical protein C8J57DRAFT_1229888 [Mycena rebaudengoi]